MLVTLALMRSFRLVLLLLVPSLCVRSGLTAYAQDTKPPGSTNGAVQSQASPRFYKVGNGVSAPRLVYTTEPEYSKQAKDAKYEGVCVLWMIVDTDGKVRDIRVARSLGLGLDEKAIEAVKTWRFEPAKKDGQPVSVAINVEVNFHLYDDGGPSQKLVAKANAGDARAQLELGMLYMEGRKVSKNERYGKDLLQRAADQGLAKAQFALAEHVYRHSPENFTDYVTAYMWYTLARRAGEEKAEMPLKALTSKMSTEQLSQAEARVANWKPTSMK